MFDNDLQQRIEILDKNLISVSSKELLLEEINKSGKTELKININNPCILFKKLEEYKLGYFNSFCPNCADYIFFEYCKDYDTWKLHIVELKKTVRIKEWKKIKEQFKGAILNSLALAGYLGVHIEWNNILLYTGLRNDKINNSNDVYSIRVPSLGNMPNNLEIISWNNKKIKIKLFKTFTCEHKKIFLDKETGKGIYNLH